MTGTTDIGRMSDAAHFLGRTKKDVVDAAVRDYIEAHREEINAAVADSLARLDGTRASLVSEVTGMSRAQIDEVGSVPEK